MLIRKDFMGEAVFELIQWNAPGREGWRRNLWAEAQGSENMVCFGVGGGGGFKLLGEARNEGVSRKVKEKKQESLGVRLRSTS